MAGAGGLFIMLLGALVGLGVAGSALGLLFFGRRSRRSGWRLALAIVMIVLSALAVLVSLPAWIVLFTGKSTREEPLAPGDFLWISALVLPRLQRSPRSSGGCGASPAAAR
ncbi:MAG TPA: hypothetical protein VF765_26140 [Polyangiaceae bacterium]